VKNWKNLPTHLFIRKIRRLSLNLRLLRSPETYKHLRSK
jgi:hypothetical protein